jgi:hypothetical protein
MKTPGWRTEAPVVNLIFGRAGNAATTGQRFFFLATTSAIVFIGSLSRLSAISSLPFAEAVRVSPMRGHDGAVRLA